MHSTYSIVCNLKLVIVVGIFFSGCFSTMSNYAEAGGGAVGKDLDKYVFFANPDPVIRDNRKQWSQTEINEISKLLDKLLTEYKGVFMLASADHKLAFYRTADITKARNHLGYDGAVSHEVIAESTMDRIYVTDSFFKEDGKEAAILHEIVHAADAGCHISYSREFVSFAGNIDQLSIATNHSSEQLDSLEKFCEQERICHGLDSQRNLDEALANDFLAFLQLTGYPIPVSVAVNLIRPSLSALGWQKHFSRGCRLFEDRKYGESILEFRAAEVIDGSAPMCHFYLGRCFAALDLPVKSSEQFLKAIEIFDSLRVSRIDPGRIRAEFNYAHELVQLCQYNDAQRLFVEVMPHLMNSEQQRIAQLELDYCVQALKVGKRH